MAFLGSAATGSMDPEGHRQADRRDFGTSVGDFGNRPDHHRDRCPAWRAPDRVGRDADG